jgi:hypothetical protein
MKLISPGAVALSTLVGAKFAPRQAGLHHDLPQPVESGRVRILPVEARIQGWRTIGASPWSSKTARLLASSSANRPYPRVSNLEVAQS